MYIVRCRHLLPPGFAPAPEGDAPPGLCSPDFGWPPPPVLASAPAPPPPTMRTGFSTTSFSPSYIRLVRAALLSTSKSLRAVS